MHTAQDPFVVGLKQVIQSKGISQKAFAEGVTSKVNLSNILNNKGGASSSMREKLSKKAGMSIEDVIAAGKQAVTGATPEVANASSFGPADTMTTSEVLNRASELNMDITKQIMQYTGNVTAALSALSNERDRLLHELSDEQSVLNSIGDSIKVVDRDLQILQCNRANTEKKQQRAGDYCREDDCQLCDDGCMAEKVFLGGKPEYAINFKDSTTESRVAYPMLGPTGSVAKVIIMTRDITVMLKMISDIVGHDIQEQMKGKTQFPR